VAASHYDTLGVRPDASAAEIRDAYRRLARLHHPDHGDVDAGAMAAINEAYRVLGEPARRAAYDAQSGRTGSAAGGSASPGAGDRRVPAPSVDTTPARYPWKLVLGMAAFGAAVVLVGAALYEPADPERPDNLLEPGSCVVIEANGDAREVTCTGEDRLVVEALVPIGGRCPNGAAAHRDRQGRGLACVVQIP
jgi:molecular chaperone DnaJ